jgi:dienelactone hydrolase
MRLLGRSALLCALVGLLSFFVGEAAFGQNWNAVSGPRLIEEHVKIPATAGNGGSYTIAATILRPDGPGPFGAVVLNHGVPGTRSERMKESSELMIGAASVFARNGYAVVMPLRRGFGATGGEYAEDPGSCANPDYRKGEEAASQDVLAAYDFARRLPYVDGGRMILAGQSAGAMVSLYAAGRDPEGLLAVLGFAAGRGGNPTLRPGVPCAIEPVAQIFETLGRTVKVPVLLHYAENDLYFNPQTTRGWFNRFAAGGARAEYVMQPAFGSDGHYIFSEGERIWEPTVQRFLSTHGVQFQRYDPSAPTLANGRAPTTASASSRPSSATGR